MKTEETPLETAVAQTADVAGHFRNGIQAVKGAYRSKIQTTKSRMLTGSVDIDTATQSLYPNANRWDYAIEYEDKTYFVEFHPASTSNVDEMIEKLKWLNWWLQEKAPHINALKPKNINAYHWVATGSIQILNTSRQHKLLATKGLLPKKIMVFK
jgi:hypothetical protein